MKYNALVTPIANAINRNSSWKITRFYVTVKNTRLINYSMDAIYEQVLKGNDNGQTQLDIHKLRESFREKSQEKPLNLLNTKKVLLTYCKLSKEDVQSIIKQFPNPTNQDQLDYETFCNSLEKFMIDKKVNTDQDKHQYIRGGRDTLNVNKGAMNYTMVDHKSMINQHDDEGSFYVTVSGEIESAILEDNDCYLSYNFKSGIDWKHRFGQDKGTTQYSTKMNGVNPLVWGMPFNISYQSHNPMGWPKMYFEIIGKDWMSRDVIKGYGCVNVPLSPGRHVRECRVFVPVNSITLADLFGKLWGIRAEYNGSEQVLTMGKGRDATRVQSKGSVRISFNVQTRMMEHLGYMSY